MKEYTNLSDPKGRVSGLNPFWYFCSVKNTLACYCRGFLLKGSVAMSNLLSKFCHWVSKGCARVLLKCGVSRRTDSSGNQPALSYLWPRRSVLLFQAWTS